MTQVGEQPGGSGDAPAEKFFTAVNIVATNAVVRLDEGHDLLQGAGVPAPVPPAMRWRRLLDQLIPRYRPVPATRPSGAGGPFSNRRLRQLLVTVAAFVVSEAIDLDRRAHRLPRDEPVRDEVDEVVAEACTASRDVLAAAAELPVESTTVVRKEITTPAAVAARRWVPYRLDTEVRRTSVIDIDRAVRLLSAGQGRSVSDMLASLLDRTRGTGPPGEPVAGTVSGLVGAEHLTGSVLARQVAPPLHALPAVHGRDDLVAELAGMVDKPTDVIQVLVGQPGCGKSTVALAVADRAVRQGIPVWWVSAGDTNQLVKGMLAIATEIGATAAETQLMQTLPEAGTDLLWRRLSRRPTPWLMVLDDADDPEVFQAGRTSWLRPSSAGTVLITSRTGVRERWIPHAHLVTVPDLDPQSGARVVLDRMGPSTPAQDLVRQAKRLSQRLGGVALALRNAGSYLGSAVAKHNVAELADALRPDRRHEHRIETIREVSLKALADNGIPGARTLLRLLSYYAPHRVIPFDVLTPARLAGLGLRCGAGDQARAWEESLRCLRDVGLLETSTTVGQRVQGVAIHPLVAKASRTDPHEEHSVDEIEQAAVALLLDATAPLDPGRPRDWPTIRRLEMHTYAVLDYLRSDDPAIVAAASELANRVAAGLIRAGLFALGEQLIQHCQNRTGVLDPTDPAYLSAEHTLAWALGLRGQFAEAQEKFSQVLLARVEVSGPHHPDTLAARDSMAWTLAEQGRLSDAQQLFNALLPDRQRYLGSAHPETLATRHRLAWIAALQGRLAEAQYELERVLVERREVLGEDHMDVFGSRYRLAWVLAWRGRLDESETMYRQLQADLKRVLETDHAATLMCRARLAWILFVRGRLDHAEQEYRGVIAERERVLGHDHPRTLRSRNDLAVVLNRGGKHEEAAALYREVLADRERVLGNDNLHTLDTRTGLAALLTERGRVAEAEERLRALIPHYEHVIGADHRSTLSCRQALGVVLLRRGKLTMAEEVFSELVTDHRRVLGPHHRFTFDARDGLAEVLAVRGALAEAEYEIRQMRHDRTHFLGADDPDTLTAHARLAWVLTLRGQYDQAEQLYHELQPERVRLLGATHPDSLTTRYRIGWMHILAGRTEKAIPLLRAVLLDQHERFGKDHPHSLRTRAGLAAAFLQSGRPDEASTYYESLSPDHTRVLGPDHPETLANRHGMGLTFAERGQLPEAEKTLREALTGHQLALDPHHPATMQVRENLAKVIARQGRRATAARMWNHLAADRATRLAPDHPDVQRNRASLTASTQLILRPT